MPISYHCTLPRVNTSSEFTIRVPGVTIPNARFPFKIGPTGHQGAIEDAFLDSLAQHNLTVTLVRLDAATNADDLKVIHAEYVVGADGEDFVDPEGTLRYFGEAGQRVASKFWVEDLVYQSDLSVTHILTGQGMNANMSDTHNLERTKYTQDLIDFDKRYAALFSGKPRTSADQNGISHEEFFKAYKTAGGFTSGTGIHYGPSMIVNAKHQSCAQNLVVEQRMLSQVFLHAANVRPESRLAQINVLADELSSPTGPLKRYSMDGQTPSPMFDLITIVEGNKENFNHLNVPLVSQPHWSKDLLNDTDVAGSEGGGGYERFGISSELVALVLVRLDGYIGMVAPAAALQDVHEHFALFLLPLFTSQNHWYGKKLTDYAQEERYECKSSWPTTATEIEDADVWGDSDESTSTNHHTIVVTAGRNTEIQILANHAADKRFAMLCGRWSTAWKVAKELARQERRETMESEKAEKPSGSSSLQRLIVLRI
ncbi:hypothetical protein F5141DRAFT_1206583 [Pisolithus sp. B1]|nr:hypothetical protein F5141DRAFT_1206583 [Pisolithus sp. B1]